jgi:hypothetical protein
MRLKLIGLLWVLCSVSLAVAAPPEPAAPAADGAALLLAPPADVQAADTPNDAGNAITVGWTASPDEAGGLVDGYEIQRGDKADGEFTKVGYVPYGFASYTDQEVPANGVDFYYRVIAKGRSAEACSQVSLPARAQEQWFNKLRVNALLGTVLFILIVIYFIGKAQKGKHLFIRKIAGLAAVDEAVGRATEMGRPILFVPGIATISDIPTIAALNILAQVAKRTAEYDTPIIVPNRDPVVYTVAQEIVKESYNEIGRPDAYNHDSVFYLTDNQMGFASGVDGIIAREKPATNFFLGYFAAEALIISETGATTGAIQIAGTDQVTQLPFFITACDYTLMGEELYAASAYLSRQPMLLGTLKGQDWSKALIGLLMLIGVILSFINPALRAAILKLLEVG